MTSDHEHSRAVEALLFVSPQPLSVATLAEALEVDRQDVRDALARLGEQLNENRGIELAEIGGGWVLRTRSELSDVVDRLRERPPDDRLSPAALETLAVTAYLEPVSRPDIGRLRGVSVDSTVASLVDRGLLEEAGRADATGAVLYRTTQAFQERFGLRERGDLPPIEVFELSGPQAEELRRRLGEAGHMGDSQEGAAAQPLRPPDGDDTSITVDTDDPGPAQGGS